jgi:hypothetical protein
MPTFEVDKETKGIFNKSVNLIAFSNNAKYVSCDLGKIFFTSKFK